MCDWSVKRISYSALKRHVTTSVSCHILFGFKI